MLPKKNRILTMSDREYLNEDLDLRQTPVGVVNIINPETGEIIFRGKNKVVVAGSAFVLSKVTNVKVKALTPTYNNTLTLNETVNDPYTGEGIRKEEQVWLFAVGTDGNGPEPNQVLPVKYTSWIEPQNLVPFQFRNLDNDLTTAAREKYFGKKTTQTKHIYYFKAFESAIESHQQWKDGTPIDENIYLSSREEEVETYAEMFMKITKDDCRDFFKETTSIQDAKVNSISLLTAYKMQHNDGFTYFQDIRPLTKYHFPAEILIDITKGVDIIYQLYF
jgi:hypothetical protein